MSDDFCPAARVKVSEGSCGDTTGVVYCEKTVEEPVMTKKKSCIWKWIVGIIIVLVCLITVWVYIHRRLIRAMIKKEPAPACPHWLPDKVKKLQTTE